MKKQEKPKRKDQSRKNNNKPLQNEHNQPVPQPKDYEEIEY